jgi:hypothetical protein
MRVKYQTIPHLKYRCSMLRWIYTQKQIIFKCVIYWEILASPTFVTHRQSDKYYS